MLRLGGAMWSFWPGAVSSGMLRMGLGTWGGRGAQVAQAHALYVCAAELARAKHASRQACSPT